MPRINRSDTYYVPLPDELSSPSLSDAKFQVSLNVTVPKGLEKVAQKIIVDTMNDAEKTFKKRMKKKIKELEE